MKKIEPKTKKNKNQVSYVISQFSDVPVKIMFEGKERKSQMRGEIIFQYNLRKNRSPSMQIRAFNLLIKSTKIKRGNTGTVSLCFRGYKSKVSYSKKKNEIAADFKVEMHYSLIDKEKGYQKNDEDMMVPFTESCKVSLKGTFAKSSSSTGEELGILIGTIRIKPLSSKAGISIIKSKPKIPWWQYRQICKNGTTLHFSRYLCLQPVFLTDLDPSDPPTGAGFSIMMQRAVEIWGKCCVLFDVRPPIYLDKPEYRANPNIPDLYAEVDLEDCVPIFYIEQWFDKKKSGVTGGPGTENALIVIPDDASPGNENLLAHELGHVLGLDHPHIPPDSTPLPLGCPDSVMEPSGVHADNPSEQCTENCQQLFNPLLRIAYNLCCKNADGFRENPPLISRDQLKESSELNIPFLE